MPKKILLADDSITIQKVVELTFSDGDYEVTAVNNGAKAIQKLAEMRPDIILSDIIMPEKNGYEVCEYVKSHPEFRNIPVVLLTGTFEPFDPDRAEKAGCDAVVTKPFESQSLIHKVEELISQSRSNSNVAPAPEPPPAAPVEAASPWIDDAPPAAPQSFTHDADIFAAAAPVQATTEMPFEIPSTPSFDAPAFENDSSFASPADTPFGEPGGEAFSGETRAFPRMSFEEMQQMAATPAPAPAPVEPPAPAPEPSPWDEPAATGGETRAFTKMSFDDFQTSAVEPVSTPEPEAESPFGAPPPAEQFSSETRAFPRMSLEEMQQMTAGGISIEQPTATPEPEPIPEPPAATSPWDEQEVPAFSGETRAFPKLDFNDFNQPAPAPVDASPFGSDADAPAFGGETRAFPKLSFDDFQQMNASPAPEPEPQPEPEPLFDQSASPFASETPAFNDEPVAAPEAGWMPAPEEPAEAPLAFSEQPMPEDLPFAAEPEAPAAAESNWSLAEPAAEVAEAEAEPEGPAIAETPAAITHEAPQMPISAHSSNLTSDLTSDLTDEQVDRIARRVVELISDQVVRNIAWEVIPDLAEMVVKERIRQLEAEA